MRQSEARDLRSFLAEPAEEVILGDARAHVTDSVGARLDVGALDVGARFTSPLVDDVGARLDVGARFTSPPVTNAITNASGAQSGLNPLRPYHLQRYQSQGVQRSSATSGTLKLRSSERQGSRQVQARITADLVPMSHKLVPIEPSPAPRSWERSNIYMWLILFTLFLLVILGGIGLDSLIASYH